jgi:hypothetical protein
VGVCWNVRPGVNERTWGVWWINGWNVGADRITGADRTAGALKWGRVASPGKGGRRHSRNHQHNRQQNTHFASPLTTYDCFSTLR